MFGKKKRRIWLPLAVLLAGAAAAALDARLAVRQYRLETARVSAPVRIALLTDLHSCDYGEGQAGLLEAVAAEDPDVVLLGGDIVDDDARMDPERAYTAAAARAGPPIMSRATTSSGAGRPAPSRPRWRRGA